MLAKFLLLAACLSCAQGFAGEIPAVLEIPPLECPGYLESCTDPVFGNTITRITGLPDSPIPNVGGQWAEVARHGYSKRAVWNADMSLLYLDRNQGEPSALFLDGKTYKPLFASRLACTEARWHPSDPERMIYVKGNELGSWNVRKNTGKILATFGDHADLHIGPWEGNLSLDGNRIVLYGRRGGHPVAFAYDLAKRSKFPDIPLDGIETDWVSISASGKYVVINGVMDGGRDRTRILTLEGKPVGETWEEYGRPSHYDLTIDADGEDIAVGVSQSAPDMGRVIKRRLRDGEVTVLTPGGFASHTSTRNTSLPGWAYATYQTRSKDWPPFYDEVVAVKLDGSMTIRRLAHLRTRLLDYETEAQAVPSPDGSRVLWASNWEAETGRPVAAYVVTVPPPGKKIRR